jgi:hypothetical protein
VREEEGQGLGLRLPYHGWSYAPDGALRMVPHAKGYPADFDKDEFPLLSLRTESYNGMIYATFRDDIMPLEEWLGPARKWIDLFMKQGAGFGVKALGEHKFRFPATGRSSSRTRRTPITSRSSTRPSSTAWTRRPRTCSTCWGRAAGSRTWAMATRSWS